MLVSLLDQLKDLLGKEIAALAAFGWAVAWATAQNFFDKLSAPTIVGPGKADILRYGMDIMQAANPRDACQKAADGIYNLLLPNFGDMMGPMVSGVTNLIDAGDYIGSAASSGETLVSQDSPQFTGQTQNTGLPNDLFETEQEADDENP